jgi:hypothetical protein
VVVHHLATTATRRVQPALLGPLLPDAEYNCTAALLAGYWEARGGCCVPSCCLTDLQATPCPSFFRHRPRCLLKLLSAAEQQQLRLAVETVP